MLHALSEFIHPQLVSGAPPSYWYEGRCDRSGAWLQLPRTAEAEAVAQALMRQLAAADRHGREGKMYGVLLAETAAGDRVVLKAFSGLLNGEREVAGWVPPIPGREQVVLAEAETLKALEAIRQQLLALRQLPERAQYAACAEQFAAQLEQLAHCQRQRQHARQQQRQHLQATQTGADLALALSQLDDQSRRDGMERRRLKQARSRALQPLQQAIDQADAQIRELKQQRQQLSQRLQLQMHAVYRLTNFVGESRSLQQLVLSGGLPTGTGDCCAPKLLHYAATHQLQPIALAEFWWGEPSASGDRQSGEFYGACRDRCQPLMGFLLAGIPQPPPAQIAPPLTVLYEDAWLMVVDKPAGLLSVPGRSSDRQDSVQARLHGAGWKAVHRLDQDTSGILLLARDAQTDRQLSQQFARRQVHKVYEAVLSGKVLPDRGTIDLPLWGDPCDRPRQSVSWQHGKPAQTAFQVTERADDRTRVVLVPLTGRTHQLRVHAAHPDGLAAPIWGDRLYGSGGDRLHLHARELRFLHPHSGQEVEVRSRVPF